MPQSSIKWQIHKTSLSLRGKTIDRLKNHVLFEPVSYRNRCRSLLHFKSVMRGEKKARDMLSVRNKSSSLVLTRFKPLLLSQMCTTKPLPKIALPCITYNYTYNVSSGCLKSLGGNEAHTNPKGLMAAVFYMIFSQIISIHGCLTSFKFLFRLFLFWSPFNSVLLFMTNLYF